MTVMCIGLLGSLVLPPPAQAQSDQVVNQITVATWSGFYSAAQEAAVFKPFTRETGIGVRIRYHNGDFSKTSWIFAFNCVYVYCICVCCVD